MKYLFLVLPFLMFGQTDIDLSNMTSNVLLGNPIGIVVQCDGTDNKVFNAVGDVKINGHIIGMNNATLNIDGTMFFGGSIRSNCSSTLCINGVIKNTDPADPGGNPFGNTNSNPTIKEFEVNGCIDLPNGVQVGWYEMIELLEQNQLLTLSNDIYDIKENYTYKDSVLTIDGVNFIKVYNMLGQELDYVKGNSIKIDYKKQILIIKTDRGSFKII